MKDTYKEIDHHQYEILRSFPEKIQNEYVTQILGLSKPGDEMLDIGFGSGLFLIPAANLNFTAKITGIDYSPTMYEPVSKAVGGKAHVILGDLFELNGSFDLIHFKAILHCFDDPEKALDKIKALSKTGGYIVTGHEDSQIEDRIEQLFNSPVIDKELELLFEHYFSLRADMGKPFVKRKYPAGDATAAVNYICKDNDFVLEKTIFGGTLSWNRVYCLNDLLYSIRYGTYNVFSVGFSAEDRESLYIEMLEFSKKNNFDMEKERTVPANFKLFIIKHKL